MASTLQQQVNQQRMTSFKTGGGANVNEKPSSAKNKSHFASMQEISNHLPAILKRNGQEMEQLKQMVNHYGTKNQTWMQLLHDRIDTLTTETKVTNMLLAELVALQSMQLHHPDTDVSRQNIRDDAYQRVLNGE